MRHARFIDTSNCSTSPSGHHRLPNPGNSCIRGLDAGTHQRTRSFPIHLLTVRNSAPCKSYQDFTQAARTKTMPKGSYLGNSWQHCDRNPTQDSFLVSLEFRAGRANQEMLAPMAQTSIRAMQFLTSRYNRLGGALRKTPSSHSTLRCTSFRSWFSCGAIFE